MACPPSSICVGNHNENTRSESSDMSSLSHPKPIDSEIGAVVDINNGSLLEAMKLMFMESMFSRKSNKPRVFPTAFLFNDDGLRIWSQITQSRTFYQTADETRLLAEYGDQIATHVLPGSTLLDIGSR